MEVKELQDVPSPVEALANAVGKYVLYRMALDSAGDHDIPLYVAITLAAYTGILSAEIGQKVVSITRMPLLVFDPYREEIVQWIP